MPITTFFCESPKINHTTSILYSTGWVFVFTENMTPKNKISPIFTSDRSTFITSGWVDDGSQMSSAVGPLVLVVYGVFQHRPSMIMKSHWTRILGVVSCFPPQTRRTICFSFQLGNAEITHGLIFLSRVCFVSPGVLSFLRFPLALLT